MIPGSPKRPLTAPQGHHKTAPPQTRLNSTKRQIGLSNTGHGTWIRRSGHAPRPKRLETSFSAGGGTPIFTDGPFAETKEVIGGFAAVRVPDEAAARHWAGRIAVACDWPQEVRIFRTPAQIPTPDADRAAAAAREARVRHITARAVAEHAEALGTLASNDADLDPS